ncbi:MAG: 5'/3'-nucleotidase SurE [Puniceicoccales bacterium]|nr:5'/3'-nucleotidase SurE [Puniceicoccales bacterium]
MVASVLITNDDGIDSAALMALVKSFVSNDWDVFVVAPSEEQSGVGRSMGLSKEFFSRKVSLSGCNAWAINGTPSDCVNIALGNLLQKKPDLVISGINWGLNITVPIIFSSGTVGGAMEGFCWGVPSIAFSQGLPDQKEHYLQRRIDYINHPGLMSVIKISADIAVDIATELVASKKVELHNVNFPYPTKPSTPVKKTRLADITLNNGTDFGAYGSLYELVGDKFIFKFPSGDFSGLNFSEGSDVSCLAQYNISDSIISIRKLCTF